MADLLVDAIHTAYGLSQVLFGVSLEVHAGECSALIGRNGVGKTTTMRSIIGLTPPLKGRVVWKGQDSAQLGPHRICRLGIGFVPEDRRIFPELSVWENLDIARRTGAGGKTTWREEQVFALFPDLAEIRDRRGGVLSGGQQQMLTIARTLMGNRSEEHTSELQSRRDLVCRLLLEKKKKNGIYGIGSEKRKGRRVV